MFVLFNMFGSERFTNENNILVIELICRELGNIIY